MNWAKASMGSPLGWCQAREAPNRPPESLAEPMRRGRQLQAAKRPKIPPDALLRNVQQPAVHTPPPAALGSRAVWRQGTRMAWHFDPFADHRDFSASRLPACNWSGGKGTRPVRGAASGVDQQLDVTEFYNRWHRVRCEHFNMNPEYAK